MNGQRGFEDLVNFICSVLDESQDCCWSGTEIFQLRFLLLNSLFYLVYNLISIMDSSLLNKYQEALHGRMQRLELRLELERFEKIHEERHHSAVDIGAAHFCGGSCWKNRKSIQKRDSGKEKIKKLK